MNWIDALIIGVISVSIYFGTKKGFFSSLFSFLSIILGFYFAGYLSRLISHIIGNHNFINWAVFTSLFVILAWVFNYLGKFIRFIGRIVISELADRLGGFMIGLLRGIALCGFLLFCVIALDIEKSNVIKKSLMAPKVLVSIKALVSSAPVKLKRHLDRIFD